LQFYDFAWHSIFHVGTEELAIRKVVHVMLPSEGDTVEPLE
jgi:hypothetical protein